jgi:hypothetical protein
MAGQDVSYDSTSVQTDNIITALVDYHSGASRNIKMLAIAHANRSKLTDVDTPSRTISLRGTLEADDIADMDDLEDTFKGIFVGRDRYLDIQHGGSTRRFIATPDAPKIERPGGLNWANFTVDFQCSSPFGVDTTSTALASGSGVTGSSATWSITPSGSAQYQYPIITVTLVSGTQMTNQSMMIGNNNNGQVCTITRDWVGGDIVIIDPLSATPLTVNGIEVEFTGSIPIFEKGAGAVSYSDTFLTRSVSYDIEQYRYWI